MLVATDELVTGEWGGDLRVASLAAGKIRATWETKPARVQIQYTELADHDEEYLLYVKPMEDYRLTLVATIDRSLRVLRHIADLLAQTMLENRSEPPASSRGPVIGYDQDCLLESQGTYAIAWRPVAPIPRSLRPIIQASALRLAQNKGCLVRFVGIASDHVHLVLQCPARRKASWAAYVFKKGIEEEITDRYGVKVSLWRTGFLADLSGAPIGGDTLLAYASH